MAIRWKKQIQWHCTASVALRLSQSQDDKIPTQPDWEKLVILAKFKSNVNPIFEMGCPLHLQGYSRHRVLCFQIA